MYERIDGGRLIGRSLVDHGVRRVFALQGGHIDPILYGLELEGIPIVDTRHEQAAALMAEGWALATGETGVSVVTAGPGFTNSLTGVANAYMNGTPMVLLAGRRPEAHADMWTLQDLNQLDIVKPMTQWARSVADGRRTAEYVRSAFAEARNGRPGPVYLDVPADVLSRSVDEKALDGLLPPVAASAVAPDPAVAERVAELLETSERPLVIAGSGAHWSGAGESISLLASTYGVPVFTVNAGRGVVADSDPWCLGAGMSGNFMSAALGADLVICLGVRTGFVLLNGSIFANAQLVRVDVDRGELARNAAGSIEVLSDVRELCDALVKCSRGGVTDARAAWLGQLREANRAAVEAADSMERGPRGGIHPAAAVRTIAEVAGENATYVTDGGDCMVWGMSRLPANGPGRLLCTSSYFGALGVGVPYAIAAKLAHPDEPCVLWTGDGAFGFNAIEFDTAVRHDIPFVAVVANNGTWGMSLHGQGLQHGYDQLVATEIGDRPYERMVEALGGYGERVEQLDDLAPAIDRAIQTNKPACVNVLIDPDVYSPVTQAMASMGIG